MAFGKTVDLGWCIAKYDPPGTQGGDGPKLIIVSPSDNGGTSFMPDQSVTIWSNEAIIRLRDFLNEVLPAAGKEGT